MNKKTIIKASIDAVMAVLFLILMNTQLFGVLVHEIIGVAILVLFLAHLAVNRKWLGTVVRRLKSGAAGKQAGVLVLNTAIAFSTATCIVTGVMISQYLFVPIAATNPGFWYDVHDLSAWVSLSLLILHGALHWRWIAGVLRQIAERAGKIKAFAARAGTGLLAAGAVFSLLNANPAKQMLAGEPTNTGEAVPYDSPAPAATSNHIDDDTVQLAPTVAPVQSASPTQTSRSVSETAQSDVTLDEYLSKLYCTACRRHCPLSQPQCGRGERQAQQATQEYNETIAGA